MRYPPRNGLFFTLFNGDLACCHRAELLMRVSRQARTPTVQHRMRFRTALPFSTLFTSRRKRALGLLGESQVSSVSLPLLHPANCDRPPFFHRPTKDRAPTVIMEKMITNLDSTTTTKRSRSSPKR